MLIHNSEKQTFFNGPFDRLSYAELNMLWGKVKKEPLRLLTKFKDTDNCLLHDFLAYLYMKDIIQEEDWSMLSNSLDVRVLFVDLICRKETSAKFKADVLNKLGAGIRFSTRDQQLTSDFMRSVNNRDVKSQPDPNLIAPSFSPLLWFARSTG